jgi:hypothetical protein
MKKYIIFLILFFLCFPVFSQNITDSNAIRTIVGEAGNQGKNGMIAVGNVIRTRKNLKGFYGFKNPIADKQPKWVWIMAEKAWAESKTNNLVKGATHFENVKAFGKPYWAKDMAETVTIKDHTFFKKRN